MLLCFRFSLRFSRRSWRIDSEVTVPVTHHTAGEFHRYIDGHKGRVAASMAWAGVGALDATFVPRKHAIAAIVICRRTEITYILLSRWPRPRRASP